MTRITVAVDTPADAASFIVAMLAHICSFKGIKAIDYHVAVREIQCNHCGAATQL